MLKLDVNSAIGVINYNFGLLFFSYTYHNNTLIININITNYVWLKIWKIISIIIKLRWINKIFLNHILFYRLTIKYKLKILSK